MLVRVNIRLLIQPSSMGILIKTSSFYVWKFVLSTDINVQSELHNVKVSWTIDIRQICLRNIGRRAIVSHRNWFVFNYFNKLISNFNTLSWIVSSEMEVVDVPLSKPVITEVKTHYRIGELIRGNCTGQYSRPASNLTWLLNDKPVSLSQDNWHQSLLVIDECALCCIRSRWQQR